MCLGIQILVDNEASWILPFAQSLVHKIHELGHNCDLISSHEEIMNGDILILLACEEILSADLRKKHKNNLVVHESNLPKGKGWSPLTWQILEGKNEVPVVLFEATDKVDAGEIYLQRTLHFTGDELIDELRSAQGEATLDLVLEFIEHYPEVRGKPQEGVGTFYRRRTPTDSELDVDKTIREQFDLLRVVDNERYPAYFQYRGTIYRLRIDKFPDHSKNRTQGTC